MYDRALSIRELYRLGFYDALIVCAALQARYKTLVTEDLQTGKRLHRGARQWLESALSGTEPVGIPWIATLAFVRLVTHPVLCENPMTVMQARQAVESWLAVDQVRLLAPGTVTFDHFFDLLQQAGTGGNLSTEAMIAALANEHGGLIYSTDRDFSRFPKVRWQNPLAK